MALVKPLQSSFSSQKIARKAVLRILIWIRMDPHDIES
jgi:hypothetical protein